MTMPDPNKFEVDQALLERIASANTAEILSIIMEIREKTIKDCHRAASRFFYDKASGLGHCISNAEGLSGSALVVRQKKNSYFYVAAQILESIVDSFDGNRDPLLERAKTIVKEEMMQDQEKGQLPSCGDK